MELVYLYMVNGDNGLIDCESVIASLMWLQMTRFTDDIMQLQITDCCMMITLSWSGKPPYL